MSAKFPYTLLPLGLLVSAFATTLLRGASDAPQPFKVTAEIMSQKFCSEDDGKAYSMQSRLHMRLRNQTDTKLIIVKQPGHGMFWLQIAADAMHFSAQEFEYDPIVDWDNFFVGPDGKEPKEELNSPGINFAILAPGESIQDENEYRTTRLGPQRGYPVYRGALHPGDHVIGVVLDVWMYHTNPEEVRKRWESFGELVYKNIQVGPLPFNLPANPKIEKCEQ